MLSVPLSKQKAKKLKMQRRWVEVLGVRVRVCGDFSGRDFRVAGIAEQDLMLRVPLSKQEAKKLKMQRRYVWCLGWI
jgi:hypothetical protein